MFSIFTTGDCTLVANPPGCSAASSGERTSFDTAAYLYYGPQGDFEITATAMKVSGNDACYPDEKIVAGKIVLADHSDSKCEIGENYVALRKAGAAAYVNLIGVNPPGFYSFRHHTWSSFHDSMPVVEVYSTDVDYNIWNCQNLSLTITGVHNTEFQRVFTSVRWTIFCRCIGGSFAVYTAAIAMKGFYAAFVKQRNQHPSPRYWNVPLVICAIEVPCMVLVATAAFGGQLGPTLFPFAFHAFMADLLMAPSFITTFLAALFLRDKTRAISTDTNTRQHFTPIWVRHRKKIAAVIFLTLVATFAPLGLVYLPPWWNIVTGILYGLLIIPVGLAIGCSFILTVSCEILFTIIHAVIISF